jgi:hypothetical protein
MPREEYLSSYKIPVTVISDNSVVITTVAGEVRGAGKTRMMGAGSNVFVNVPTGEEGPTFDEGSRYMYGLQLAKLLNEFKVFLSVVYSPEGKHTTWADMEIRVIFNETYVGGDGWPTELDVTVNILQKKKIVFTKNYTASSGSFGGGCWSCFPTDVATKTLNEKLFKDLNIFLSKSKTN